MNYKYRSGFADHITSMMEQRALLGYATENYHHIYANFDRFCITNFPDEIALTQEIALAWCNDAQGNAGSKRAVLIRSLARYMLADGEDAYIVPPMFYPYQKPALPSICTDSEIKNFFDATDRFPRDCRYPLLEYTIPVIFRLQYACGMRPQEVRNLRRADVNFSDKTVYIVDGKHYKDRKLPVDEYVMDMCWKYNVIAESVTPGRAFFFQSSAGDKAYCSNWLSDNFARCWEMSGNGSKRSNCVPYSLRHRYATETMMRWLDEGKELEAWIPYLSAYMGHASFTATYYYIHLLPERLARLDYMHTNHIIPEALDYEEII
jgi:integrase